MRPISQTSTDQTSPPAPRPQLVVGTAGHIDHGKSRLVHVLTGTDPDRLPEEKARGMTIELGFAYARIDGADIWFVDVPGHERFIRTMVAGATGIDLALLVVAADDSVMPQTREHAEVLKLLGVRRCLVVLTKMDLVDHDWADAVESEVRELLESLGIAPLQFVRTSAETGRGFDELRAALAQSARAAPAPAGEPRPGPRGSPQPAHNEPDSPGYTWFRLPIDRAFTIPGRGTVVTGSVMHGGLAVGEELELWPAGQRVRIRDLQTHHETAAAAVGRMRLAINLAGVPLERVTRGCELASPDSLEPTRCLEVWLERLRAPGKRAKRRMRVRLHLATSEVRGILRLTEVPSEWETGELYAQAVLEQPVVAAWGQRFILRDDSDQTTLGGGRVLRPVSRPWTARRPPAFDGLALLRDGRPKHRLLETLRHKGWDAISYAQLATRAGLPNQEQARKLARELCTEGKLIALAGDAAEGLTPRTLLDQTAMRLLKRLHRQLDAAPRWPGVARREWPSWMPRACPARLRAGLADWLAEQEAFAMRGDYLLPRERAGVLSDADRALYEAMLAEFDRAAFQPPAIAELTCRSPRNEPRLAELVELAAARGDLRRVGDHLWLHMRRWEELSAIIRALLAERGPFTVSDLRIALNSTRKFAVPIAEALDAAGFTSRVDDRREAGPQFG